MDIKVKRALISLKGLSIGDALGESYFAPEEIALERIKNRLLPDKEVYKYTDDTEMTLSIVNTLINKGKINQNYLAKQFTKRFNHNRGYGRNVYNMIHMISLGADWRKLTTESFDGKGSFGNGSAMRVPPIGAFFADDIRKVIENATLSAEVTHSHPEAIAGAIAVALAASFAANIDKETDYNINDYYDYILENTPESETRSGIFKARNIVSETSISAAAEALGTGFNISCQDTVFFVIWSSARHLLDFEEAFWATVEGLGDRDTTCAMVCGIVALSSRTPIPESWLNKVESLPEELELLAL